MCHEWNGQCHSQNEFFKFISRIRPRKLKKDEVSLVGAGLDCTSELHITNYEEKIKGPDCKAMKKSRTNITNNQTKGNFLCWGKESKIILPV